jgi:hypothetical protein
MTPDADREEARLLLQLLDGRINRFTAMVAETSAQRHTLPQEIAAMEHLLAILETLRDGYRAVLAAFDQDEPERAGALLEELKALTAQLRQQLEGP